MADIRTLLGNPQPVVQTGPPGKELGAQTQQIGGLGGWAAFTDEMEYVPELSWPSSIFTYHRMRSDSQIEALHLGSVQPVREYRWSIDPNKAPTKIVEQAAADLGLPIKGHEDEPLELSPSKFDFDTFLGDALLAPLYGHMHFEIVGQVMEAEWHMEKLSPRHPRTLQEFQQDPSGELTGIRQNIGGVQGGWTSLPPPIPASKLVPFVWRPEAGSHIGRAMLRALYREWLVKDRTIRVAAINLERAGGVPVIEGPQGASDAQIRDLAELARQFKVAEGGGGAIPFGSKLTLVGGNVPSSIELLKYCDECMARVWSLMLIQLGVTSGANRALGGEFATYAARAQRAMAKWVKAKVDRFLENYTKWNDETARYAPLLAFEQSRPDAMSVTDMVALVEADLITVDPELESWLRSEYGLPPSPLAQTDPTLGDLTPAEVALVQSARTPPALPSPSPTPSPILDPTSIDPTLASAGKRWRRYRGVTAALELPDRTLHREPTANEIRAAVNFRALDQAHGSVFAALHDAFLADVLPKQISALGEQIRNTKAGEPRKTITRTAMAKVEAPIEGEELLKARLLEAARSGAATAGSEMTAQGVSAEMPSDEILAGRVGDQAGAVAELAANGISLAAQRKAASLISEGGRTPDQVAKEVEDHLAGMKHAWTREQLKGAVTMAQNQGRIAAFVEAKVEEAPVFEASEILDDRTCFPCSEIDGKVFDDLAEATEAYAAGGYVECEGGPNCRGTLIAVFPEQNPAADSNPLGGTGGAYIQPEPALV